GATYDKDPKTGKVDRGKLIPIKGRPLFMIPQFKRLHTSKPGGPYVLYRYQLQILTRPLDYMKIVLLGCLVGGVDSDNSMAQVIALFCISLLALLLTRLSRPFPSRLDMAVTLLAEAADVVTFALGIVLLAGPNEDRDFRLRIGTAMLCVEGVALLTTLVEHLIIGFGICGWLRGKHREKKTKPSKFVAVVEKVMMQNTRRLERKYFERWMVKVLRRGLHNRPLRGEERSWKENFGHGWKQLTGDVGKSAKGVRAINRKVGRSSRSRLINSESPSSAHGQNGAERVAH
ncbi:unnamed protein product, partial [Ostreobium quekettii]